MSENGWTNNVLGLEWLKHFDAHTKTRQRGVYRLLILDGHKSHLSQDFKDYCLENKILTLCMPAHSSLVLQPLDVVLFLPLKRKYSQKVRDLAHQRVFHINKEGFLPAFRDAFFYVFTTQNCTTAFQASGLVPLNAQVVVDQLNVRLRTPPAPPPGDTLWQSKTPSNTLEFGSQSKLVRKYFQCSPTTLQDGYSQLIKGAEHMLQKAILLDAQNCELQEQLEVMTRRKSRKRKRLQTGGTIEYGEGALQAAPALPLTVQPTKKACSSGGGRCCGNWGEAGHNVRSYTQAPDKSSES
jgi:hypothetical protein